MALGYFAHDNVETKLNTLQLEVLIWYAFNPNTRFESINIGQKAAPEYKKTHEELEKLSMLHISEDVTDIQFATYELAPRGNEFVKRILKMPIPVARIVWTLPEDEGETNVVQP